MRNALRWSMFLILFLGCTGIGYADRAALPFLPNARLSVPRQQAILGWNGSEEILILGTDRRASQPVKVLEVLPLPAEPTIWKPKEEVFDIARTTIAQNLQKARSHVAMGFAGAPKGHVAGEVTKHRRIGTHDIRVIQVKDPHAFVQWAEENLRTWGAQAQDLPAPFRRVINTYIREGYTWFAFDIVELGPETGTLEPVAYRFRSDHLYFPLRVSTLDQGDSSVELIVLSDQQLAKPALIGQADVKTHHAQAQLSAADQRKIDSHIAGLFPGKGTAWVATWELLAKTSMFTADLHVRPAGTSAGE